jgi:hypothetical protein
LDIARLRFHVPSFTMTSHVVAPGGQQPLTVGAQRQSTCGFCGKATSEACLERGEDMFEADERLV